MRSHELITGRRTQFKREYKRPARDLRRGFVGRIGEGLAGRTAGEALEEYLAEIEARMADIATRRSRHFWLHLSRRIPPVPLEGSTSWTTLLYRTVFSLALLKYGRPYDGVDDFEVQPETGTLVPREMSYADCRDIYDLEYLAFEFNHAATSYRRVGKGAVVLPISESEFGTEAESEVERLMQLVDRRTERYYSIFSPFGSALDVSAKALRGEARAARWVLPFAALNVGREEFPPKAAEVFGLAPTGTMNHVPGFLATGPIRDLLALYEPQIVELLGLASSQLLAFLSSVGVREFARITTDQRWAIQFFQRAYWVTKMGGAFDQTLDELAQIYAPVLSDQTGREVDLDTARSEVRAIFSALTYTDEELRQISLWDKAPYKLILRHGDYFVWDYSNTQSFLRGLMSQIGFLSGEVGNLKSENFENEVLQLIRATDGVELWEGRKELKAPDGTKRQIDASFIRKDVLYLIECKAFSAHPRIDRGDWAALQDRWKMLVRYLDQAKTLRDFLETHPEGANYRVPERVVRIEHCLCTPHVEYVPDTSGELWFDDETARICIPQELIEFAKGEKPRLLTEEELAEFG